MSISGILKQFCLSKVSNADRFLLRYAGNQNYSTKSFNMKFHCMTSRDSAFNVFVELAVRIQ